MKPPRTTAAGTLVAMALAALSSAALAQTWPSRPVRLVIGYAPGGNTDLIGRVLASGMQKKLGQSIVVENRPGAAAAIARDAVSKAAPDGYTLLTETTSLPASMVFVRNPPLDVQKAFAPISLLTESPGTIVARADAPFATFADMIAWARKNPGRLNYGGIGPGTVFLSFESMKAQYGIDVVAVEYKSSADAYRALLTGDVQLASAAIGRVAGDLAAGKLRVLSVGAPARHPALPNHPTARELGFTGFYTSWQGLWAPAGTPAEIVRGVHAAVQDAVAQKEVRDGLEKLEAIVLAAPPEALAERLARDIREWREIVARSGIPLQ